ncbi:MAG: fabG [Hydrocarboniphaga sp.]|uniref:SDR family NAD(P)-dependent oxidoreductase n=1 Tax=Hydrocarboniphaga sp. TaxID=2033016 RepID=UPI0026025150|nr:SDR family oxidoreductase [Hydrocarboniphaga sp.]MDB5972447.1 fabG [Hydrocarboniphaga sp.]
MSPVLETLFGLHGKIAVITGGAGGIGREIARALAQAGAHAVIADIDTDNAESLASALRDEGLGASATRVDLNDEAQIAAMFERVRAQIGSVDILVNNAGSYPKYDFFRITREQWDAVHHLNLRASFVCMQHAIGQMLEAGHGGRVINISSVASQHPATISNMHYAAAKAGVDALTRGAALEFSGRGITVNSVLPGPIAVATAVAPTPTHSAPVTGPAADRQRWLAGRSGTPMEVAAAVLFFAGAGGAYTSGQALAVDGGFLVS